MIHNEKLRAGLEMMAGRDEYKGGILTNGLPPYEPGQFGTSMDEFFAFMRPSQLRKSWLFHLPYGVDWNSIDRTRMSYGNIVRVFGADPRLMRIARGLSIQKKGMIVNTEVTQNEDGEGILSGVTAFAPFKNQNTALGHEAIEDVVAIRVTDVAGLTIRGKPESIHEVLSKKPAATGETESTLTTLVIGRTYPLTYPDSYPRLLADIDMMAGLQTMSDGVYLEDNARLFFGEAERVDLTTFRNTVRTFTNAVRREHLR